MSGVKRVFSLYREILRTHRTLPSHMKELGSAYAREEFRLHLRSDKIQEKQWREFISSWEQYVDSLRGGGDKRGVSGDLNEDVVEQLSPEQREQLLKLKDEALRFKFRDDRETT